MMGDTRSSNWGDSSNFNPGHFCLRNTVTFEAENHIFIFSLQKFWAFYLMQISTLVENTGEPLVWPLKFCDLNELGEKEL